MSNQKVKPNVAAFCKYATDQHIPKEIQALISSFLPNENEEAVHGGILEYLIVESRHRKIEDKKRSKVEKTFPDLVWAYMAKLLKSGFNVTYKGKKINIILESYHGGGDKKKVAKAIKDWTDFCTNFTDTHSCNSFVCMVAKWILDEEGFEEDKDKYSSFYI